MGTLKMITAKVKDTSLWDSTITSNGTFTVDTNDFRIPDYGLLTGRAFRPYVNGISGVAYGVVTIASKSTLYTRMACKLNTTTATEISIMRYYEGASTVHTDITVIPSTGQVKAYRSTTVLATSAISVFSPSTWFVIEVWNTIHDTTGRIQVRINGNSTAVIDFTGDTRNAGTGVIDSIRMGLVASAPNPTEMYMDDVMVRDDTWCGAGAIYLLLPDGAGSTTNWTASTGTVHECIDELPVDWTDYAYTDATVANTRHLVTVQNPTVTPLSITAVAAIANMRVTAAGGGNANTVIKSGSSVLEGSSVALDVSGRWVVTYADTNPDGSVAWTASALNAVEIGIESA